MPQMTASQKTEVIMIAFRKIFNNKDDFQKLQPWILNLQPRMFKDSSTGLQTIPGIDIILDINEIHPNGTMKPKNLRFIAQNPNKLDGRGNLKENAILARAGHKIMWVIDKDIQNGFLGKVMDGKWEANQPRATYAARNPETAVDPTGRTYQMDQGNWTQRLPDIDKDNVADAIIEQFEGDEECQCAIE